MRRRYHLEIALSVAALGGIGCKTASPRPEAPAPIDPIASTPGLEPTRFRGVELVLPKELVLKVDESGLVAEPAVQTRCGGPRIELSVVALSGELPEPSTSVEGVGCRTARYERHLDLAAGVKARLVCEARGALEGGVVETACDAIVASANVPVQGDAYRDASGLPNAGWQVRPIAGHQDGAVEFYQPGAPSWFVSPWHRRLDLDGQPPLDDLLSSDQHFTGDNTLIVLHSGGTSTLVFEDYALAIEPASGSSASPVDLLVTVREGGDPVDTVACHVWSFRDGRYSSSGAICPP